MSRMTTTTNNGGVRQPTRSVVALVVLSVMAVACASDGRPADQASRSLTSGLPPTTTQPAALELGTSSPIESTGSPTSAAPTNGPAARSTPPIPLDDDDRVFYAGVDTVIVADAPPPWTPFPVSTLGMRRDMGTAEWVGISFWEPWEVATDSCQWEDSWVDPGESVDELAAALVAIPGRDATAPVPVTVGGHDGLYLEWSLPSDLDITTCDEEKTVAWTGAADKTRSHDLPGVIDRIWILDVAGKRILIDVISLPVEQDVIRERVDEVIDSLRFAASR